MLLLFPSTIVLAVPDTFQTFTDKIRKNIYKPVKFMFALAAKSVIRLGAKTPFSASIVNQPAFFFAFKKTAT